jgi:hypothetical protein
MQIIAIITSIANCRGVVLLVAPEEALLGWVWFLHVLPTDLPQNFESLTGNHNRPYQKRGDQEECCYAALF